jgi:RNA polymerase sigma factor (sigma-70 family)
MSFISCSASNSACPPKSEDHAKINNYAQAYRDGFRKTVRFLAANGAPPELAEEVAQAAWVRGWERLDQLRHADALMFWINSIAKNFLRNSFRRRHASLEAIECTLTTNPLDSAPIDSQRVFDGCDDKEQLLLKRYYLEGFTSRELSREFGLSPVGVRVRLTRLKKTITKRMAAEMQTRAEVYSQAA